MHRKYEIVYIFDSALEDTQINERLTRFHELLKTPEFPEPVTDLSHWGRRTLAYPVSGKEQGYYVVSQFETDGSSLPEFERAIKLDDGVLRHLVVINDGLATTPTGIPDRKPSDSDEGRPSGRPAADTNSGDEEGS